MRKAFLTFWRRSLAALAALLMPPAARADENPRTFSAVNVTDMPGDLTAVHAVDTLRYPGLPAFADAQINSGSNFCIAMVGNVRDVTSLAQKFRRRASCPAPANDLMRIVPRIVTFRHKEKHRSHH